jgi:hypothetical protein
LTTQKPADGLLEAVELRRNLGVFPNEGAFSQTLQQTYADAYQVAAERLRGNLCAGNFLYQNG